MRECTELSTDPSAPAGYTSGMKTAVSVPNDVFKKAERLARRQGRTRSDVYTAALREYVARHFEDEVTAAVERVVTDLGEPDRPDPFLESAARVTLAATDW